MALSVAPKEVTGQIRFFPRLPQQVEAEAGDGLPAPTVGLEDRAVAADQAEAQERVRLERELQIKVITAALREILMLLPIIPVLAVALVRLAQAQMQQTMVAQGFLHRLLVRLSVGVAEAGEQDGLVVEVLLVLGPMVVQMRRQMELRGLQMQTKAEAEVRRDTLVRQTLPPVARRVLGWSSSNTPTPSRFQTQAVA